MRLILFKIIIILNYNILFGQHRYYINDLVEQNDYYLRRFTGDTVRGEIYRSFEKKDIDDAYVGFISSSGKSGRWTNWWKNGKKKLEGEYRSNKKHGFWTEWDKNGIKYYESIYKEGVLIQIKNCTIELCDSTWNKIINEKF